MQKFFVNENQINNEHITVTNNDFNHIKNVLRYEIGEKLEISVKENGISYFCEIVEINKENVICKIKEQIQDSNESNIHITVFQGLPKSDKMELIIQKCTELGVKEFTPVEMNRCVVKLKENDKPKKVERWNKIAEVAAKQCGRDDIPKVNNVINVKQLINEIPNYNLFIVAYENENQKYLKEIIKESNLKNSKIGIVIGPEGGFEEKEILELKNVGANIISLGKRILRTETVALVLTSILMYECGDISN